MDRQLEKQKDLAKKLAQKAMTPDQREKPLYVKKEELYQKKKRSELELHKEKLK